MFSPKDVIKKSYLKQKLVESEFTNFKQSLTFFLNDIKDNDEEYNKTLLKELLENSIGYSTYKINTKEKIDLAVYKDNVPEIIMELKAPKNKSEMISVENLNKRALHETILYYLREKLKNKNFNLKHIVITNSIEWFVFDAVEFNKISTNRKIEKLYKDKELNKTLFTTNNDEFYKIIEDILKDETILKYIKYTRFYLKDKQTDTQLKNIYKLLSPTHLLKLYNYNDSNSLNKNFYYELLHILGLEETGKNKKVIGRKSEATREDGSLLENTILKLSTTHGVEGENKLFEIALQLNITWLNRILFLKLLEARLLKIHNGKYLKFLSYDIVNEFDKLDTLFFEVLAKRISNRKSVKIEQFKNIPYLNSSLFEPTELEKKYLLISNLKDNLLLKKHSKTVLKVEDSNLKSMEYLLKFLSAYDFGSDYSDEFKKEHSSLINSSVLGLIFEKLNGYKDGSFFTPAFITMYMTKQSIRKTVIEKFNQEFNWDCKTIDDIYNKDYELDKANELLNSITICDPAVGSGHFLVSGLNELLSIKSELGMLIDENGKRLKNVKLIAEDDEIYILDEDGEFFDYKVNNDFKVSYEIIRVQKTIFNEKLHIIENQLFGVDININSAKITQLRLWIELLKDSYYDENNELVTLPNIDINIKCGNSLISKYPLKDSDTKNKLLKEKLNDYKKYVKWYKDTNDKDIKKEVISKIDNIKQSFSQRLKDGSPQINEIKKLLNGDNKTKSYIEQYGFKGLTDDLVMNYAKQSYCLLYARFGKEYNPSDSSLFGAEIKLLAKEKKEHKAKQEKDLKNILKKYEIIKDFEDAKIYENSFEWRFEFPEVLSEDGEYIGFDIVIGNPPYGAGLDDKTKKFYKDKYKNVHMRTVDTFNYFISMSSSLLNDKAILSFIVPNNLLYQNEYEKTRELLINNYTLLEAINLGDNIFEDANVPTCIVEYQNSETKENYDFKYSDIRDSEDKQKEFEFLDFEQYNKNTLLKVPSFIFGVNPTTVSLIEKVKVKSYLIDDIALEVASGISTGGDKIFRVSQDFINEHELEEDILHKVLVGREINKYEINYTNHKVLYTTRDIEIDEYPNILNYLEPFKEKLMTRSESKKGILPWSSLNRQRYNKLFTESKILIRQTADSVIATFDENRYFSLDSTLIFKIDPQFDIDYKFATAILNAKLTTFIYKNYTGEDGRAFAQVKPKNIRKLYIPEVDKTIQDEFVKIVDKIMERKKACKSTSKLECLIDKKVYALYGLDDEEIKMVERYDKN